MPRRPSESQDKFIIRLPDGMREQIKAAAEANARTMTGEIVYRLAESFALELERPQGLKFVAKASEVSAKARAANPTRDPLDEILRRLEAIEQRLALRSAET